MTQVITITFNGDAEGVDAYIPHDAYLEFLLEHFTAAYPKAEIALFGNANTIGGNKAVLIETLIDEDGWEEDTETDLHDELQQAWVAACDREDLWNRRNT